MNKFRFRLLFVILAIILLVITGLGIVIGQLFKDFYLEEVYERLKKETNLSVEQIVTTFDDQSKMNEVAMKISEQIDARVTIINKDGTVIAETEKDYDLLENHLNRPEIVATLKGEDKYFIRYSETLKKNLLYYAVALYDDQNNHIGFFRLGIPTEMLQGMNKKIWATLIVSFFIAFTVITTLILRITNQMFRPIEEIKNVTQTLAEGNYHIRLAESGNDEIGELARSLNILAHKMAQVTKRHQTQQERLETLIENMGSGLVLINTRGDITLMNGACKKIFRENTEEWINKLYYDVIKHKEVIRFIQDMFMTEKAERRQVTMVFQLEVHFFDVYGAPILSNDGKLNGVVFVFHDITELKKLEQIRKDFVANVSHELRTPVTSIKGFSETLLEGAMDDVKLCEKFLTIIYKESERLQNLIHDLLELSRLEQSHFQLNMQSADLRELVEDVIELLKNKAEEKEIQIETKYSGNTQMLTDPLRMKQVIINLINNGITYTPNGGKIFVNVQELGDEVQFVITDTGIGMSELEIPRIFERFYRIDRARSRNSGGTGLGLAIVKHIIELHDGRIDVNSQVGKGTTFTIILPKK